jgi:hypothetical protein
VAADVTVPFNSPAKSPTAPIRQLIQIEMRAKQSQARVQMCNVAASV